MFENDLVELDAAGTLAAAEANEHTLITAETRRLQIAAHWADLHPGEAVVESRLPGTEHPIRLGGEGTPTVGDFAAAELGCVLRMSDGSAARLIGDALDLRHRLPLIWAAAQAGQVPAYQARMIAKATRHLTVEQAAAVDARIAPSLGALPWGRVQTLLDAAIVEADPAGAEQRAADAAKERFVRLGRTSEHGLKLIIARAAAGDAIWFKATVDRIADILARQGDTDTVEVRRSKAIGILAQPALALQLLCQHQHDDCDGPAEPTEPAEEPKNHPNQPRMSSVSLMPRRMPTPPPKRRMPTSPPLRRRPTLRLTRTWTVRIAHCRSCRRRSGQNGPGPAQWSMCTSAAKPSPPAPASPASKTSARSCSTGSACCSATTVRST